MGSYPEMDGRLKPPVVHGFAAQRTNTGVGGSNLLMVCCVISKYFITGKSYI